MSLTSVYPPSLHQNMVHNGGIGIGAQGQALMSNINNVSWSNSDTRASISVEGNAVINGTLTVGGQEITKTINERLDVIEQRLNILRPNPDLEGRWEELRLTRERYLELEAEFTAYERVIDILKT